MEELRFPKKPPDGLIDFAVEGDGGTHVMFYQCEWVPDHTIGAVLEGRVGRKTREVRCTCSHCGGSFFAPYMRGGCEGYGFEQVPELDFTDHGSDMICPLCGAECVVIKASTVAHGGYFETDTYRVCSASVEGKGKALVLTMWDVIRRVYRDDLREELVVHPCYGYQFFGTECRRYSAALTIYGGNYGYKTAYRNCWGGSRKVWRETMGSVDAIFGLTPELVAESCLPHCKLDVYMRDGWGMFEHYPVSWLRLYQVHPNAEVLLVHGLANVVCDLIKDECENVKWREENWRGMVELSEIAWEETRPAQMLRLNRDELAFAQSLGFGAYCWRLYVAAKEHGERLDRQTFETIHKLGDENLLALVGQCSMRRIVRYLERQIDRSDAEINCVEEDLYEPDVFPDSEMLADYWKMQRDMGMNLEDLQVRFPRDLIDAHDQAVDAYRRFKDEKMAKELAKDFARQREKLRGLDFGTEAFCVHAVTDYQELHREGDLLHHCVVSYAEDVAKGKTAIFLLRRTAEADKPFFTVEVDMAKLRVKQNLGLRNCAPDKDVRAFVELWIEWARAGCQRDKDGAPLLPEADRKKTSA